VLISLDTLRADRVGAYGYPLPVTPNLDRFAAEGTLMEHATALANWTTPSHATMLTGLYPCAHGFRATVRALGKSHRFPAGVRTLADLLRERGYRTVAFTEDAFVDRIPFQQGFGRFEANRGLDGQTPGLAEGTFGHAAAWLAENADVPFFLFVHTYQVHGPYTPPADELARIPTPLPLPPHGVPPAAKGADDAVAYTAEVAYTDRVVGTFLDVLERLGLGSSTIVIITADHGEAFGEHGIFGHGIGLWEEEMRIPLLWRAPGRVAAGRRLDTLATLADVVPTVLALLGQPVPPAMQGVSLAPLLDPAVVPRRMGARVIPLEGLAHRGLRGPGWKVISLAKPRARIKRFLSLAGDPEEKHPVVTQPKFIAGAQRWVQRSCERAQGLLGMTGEPTTPESVPIDPEQERKLRALGYVEPHSAD
jgi:arylsulfatase A-like enzyme